MDGLEILLFGNAILADKSVGKLLNDRGALVYTSSSVEHASELIRSNSVDIVMTSLPGGDRTSIDLLHGLIQGVQSTYVLAIVDDHDARTTKTLLGRSSLSVLLSPYNETELIEAVNQAHSDKSLDAELAGLRSLSPVLEMGKRITGGAGIEELAHSILTVAVEETDADSGSIMLIDSNTQSLYVEASQGLDCVVSRDDRQPLGQGVAGWVAQNAKPLHLGADGVRQDNFGQPLDREDLLSSVSIPITYMNPGDEDQSALGVLNLNKKDGKPPFTKDDLDMLTVLCCQISVALKSFQLYTNLQDSYLGTMDALASAIDAKDSYTSGHSSRVSTYAIKLAGALGMSDQEISAIHQAGRLHDIGKIGVSDQILTKPSALTEGEYREMRQHPQLSHKIIGRTTLAEKIGPAILHHHEFMDGSGYPDGLSGENIPYGARILAIADAYEAMTSDRPYRLALDKEVAIGELHACSGKQFDPDMVKVFVASVL